MKNKNGGSKNGRFQNGGREKFTSECKEAEMDRRRMPFIFNSFSELLLAGKEFFSIQNVDN
jgi:hypothetical protein